MKIARLTAHFFRGFQDHCRYDFDGQLVLVRGENGSGKTSLAEAIEWLLYGQVSRHEVSGIDLVERRGALINVKCQDDVTPYVSAIIQLDHETGELRREFDTDDDSASQLYFKDEPIDSLEELGFERPEAYHPIILQDNLQQIIDASGVDRRRAISRILGLQPLNDLDRALDHAVQAFEGRLNPDIQDSLRTFRSLQRLLKEHGLAPDLCAHWDERSISFQDDWDTWLDHCRNQLGTPGHDENELRATLRETLERERRKLFDYSDVQPVDNYDAQIELLEESQTALEKRAESVSKIAGEAAHVRAHLLQTVGEVLTGQQRDFFQTAIKLTDRTTDSPYKCPLCLEPTLTEERVSKLQYDLSSSEEYQEITDRLERSVQELNQTLDSLDAAAATLSSMDRLEPEEHERAKTLLGADANTADDIDSAYSALLEITESVTIEAASLQEELEHLKAFVAGDLTLQDAAALEGLSTKSYLATIDEFTAAHSQYVSAFSSFKDAIDKLASTDETVKQLEVMGRVLDAKEHIRASARAHNLRDELREARSHVRDFWNRKEEERLTSRSEEVSEWFRLLYAHDQGLIDFDGLEARGTIMRLYARILGEQRHAPSHLSQSQLNCLGLALHITSSLVDSCPFDFIAFDDPIQSFDDEIRESFIADALGRLLRKENKQVIVLTHLKSVGDRILHAYESSFDVVYLRAQSLSPEGIQMSRRNQLEARKQKILRSAGGSSAERRTATQEIRPLTELVCKRLYCAVTEEVLPRSYESANVPELVDLLNGTEAFKGKELDELRNAGNFGVKAGHDDAELSDPPSEELIRRQLKTLTSIGRRHNLPF